MNITLRTLISIIGLLVTLAIFGYGVHSASLQAARDAKKEAVIESRDYTDNCVKHTHEKIENLKEDVKEVKDEVDEIKVEQKEMRQDVRKILINQQKVLDAINNGN